jgi:hypothetical protein
MNSILTLILAWRMAKQYEENESKAIYLCACKIWKEIKNENVKNLVMQLAQRKTTDKQRIASVQELERRIRLEKMI